MKRLFPAPTPAKAQPTGSRQPGPTTATPATTTTTPPGEQQVVELYPIFDRINGRRMMVNAERYEQERATLGRLLRYLAKTIPADAKEVLEAYPFGEVKDMYAEVTEALTTSGQRYARGELAAARFWAREASQFTGIEAKAHDLFLKEGMWSYVGKRVGLAVIGFFEGAAEGMVGLIDTGASLFGYHPDLEGKIAERYTQIKDAYSDAIGIDHNLTHDAAIGRFGGKLAENLATGKAIGQLGRIGTVINVAQAAAGAKSTVEAVVAMREQGRSWSDIVSDPVMLAQFAGSLAGVAGVGGSAIPQLRSALSSAGLVLNAGQMTALTTALLTYKEDPNLSEQQNFSRRADLLADVLSSAAFLGEDVRSRVAKPAEGANEARAATKDGEHEAHVHDGEVELCPIQRCVGTSKVVKGDGKAENEVEQARQMAATDPKGAAIKAAAAVDDAGISKPRRREMIAEAAERREAGKRAVRSMTDREIELLIAGFDEPTLAGKPGVADLKRPPEQRADYANKPLTSKERKALDRKIAQMKAAGLLPRGFRYRPPKAAGWVIPRAQARRAAEIIGVKVTDHPAVAECWRQAADAALGGRRLTKQNYAEMYKSAQGRFWRLVNRNEAAKRFFVDQGFTVTGSRAAYLDVGGVHGQEISLGLDHTLPKATGDNYKLALDGDSLQFLMQADNTKLSHLEKKDPSLRREGDDDTSQ